MRWVIAAAVFAALIVASPAAAQQQIRAGVGVVDASWHVGASAGQYASTRNESTEGDPHVHQFKNAPSYGVQSRLEMRAIVVEGPQNPDPRRGRNRFALVKTDLYIPQDLLYRRAAQLIKEKGVTGIDRTNLVMTATHDHSSPFYTSTAWGAWSFQDVFDIRAYEYYAERIAAAVAEAAKNLKPVRVGGTTIELDKVHRNSMGPTTGDDGTPAGAPWHYTDHGLGVVRFDDISDPAKPKPLAVLVNYSNHPEGLDGNDLISADWIAHLERMIDKETGGTAIYTQNAVGHSEMERSSHRPPSERHEYYHREYAQSERAARVTSDAALTAWRLIGEGSAQVPFVDGAAVDFHDAWFPGPLTHPYPAVSNCRVDQTRAPVVGLPECQGPSDAFKAIGFPVPPMFPNGPQLVVEQLEKAGIPVPENLGAPSFTGLEEDVGVHLQAFRIGDIFVPICSCEQWADQSLNLKARTDRVAGNELENLGYDWSARCTSMPGGDWTCPNPRDETKTIAVPNGLFEKMRAQVRNDAHGWNALEYAPYAESEPADPKKIKGNFTHDDNASSAALGYGMTMPISMANDYNGYIVSYREYQMGDHYRKSLAGWGPHSSDYMTTRLVKLGRLMKGGPDLSESVRDAAGKDAGLAGTADPDADHPALDAKTRADVAQNDARAQAIGTTARAVTQAYEATLPDDGGKAEITRQPADVQRFDLASLTFTGGSNYTDNPVVRAERREDSGWVRAAGGAGEIVTTLKMPSIQETPAYRAPGATWSWTAHFEAFQETEPGVHRFVVEGRRREGGKVVPYRLVSREFAIGRWSGITVDDVRREADGVSFRVGPRRTNVEHVDFDGKNPKKLPLELGPIDYPDSYAKRPERARFIHEQREYTRDPQAPGGVQLYCLHCSFRAWADTGDAVSATVTIARPSGRVLRVPARPSGGRWVTDRALRPGEAAYVCPGAVRDRFGNVNGALSAAVGASDVALSCHEPDPVGTTPVPTGAPAQRGGDFGANAASLGLPPASSSSRSGRGAAPLRLRDCRLRVRVRTPRPGLRVRSAQVWINGRRTRTLRGRAVRRTLTLRRSRTKTTVVKIRVRASDGRRYTAVRRYGRCG